MIELIDVIYKQALGDDEEQLEAVRIGHLESHAPMADLYVVARDRHGPRLRVDVYGDPAVETFPFTSACWWSPWVAIGFGHAVYLVSLDGQRLVNYPLGSYFGALSAAGPYLLIASAERIFCLDHDGGISWVSAPLGQEGVAIASVDGGVISGEGEWGTARGRQPFALSLETGKPL